MSRSQRHRKREACRQYHEVMKRMSEEPKLAWEVNGINSMLRLNLLVVNAGNRKSPIYIEQKIQAYVTATADAERAIMRLETKELIETGADMYNDAMMASSIMEEITP